MKKETFDYIAKRVDILAVSDFSTQITKDAALAWKNAVAADNSDAAVEEATTNLLNILEGRPTTINGVIAFLEGPAKEMMGEEAAAQALAAQLARKEAGAKWCDCEACSAATEILAKFGRIADLPQNQLFCKTVLVGSIIPYSGLPKVNIACEQATDPSLIFTN